MGKSIAFAKNQKVCFLEIEKNRSKKKGKIVCFCVWRGSQDSDVPLCQPPKLDILGHVSNWFWHWIHLPAASSSKHSSTPNLFSTSKDFNLFSIISLSPPINVVNLVGTILFSHGFLVVNAVHIQSMDHMIKELTSIIEHRQSIQGSEPVFSSFLGSRRGFFFCLPKPNRICMEKQCSKWYLFLVNTQCLNNLPPTVLVQKNPWVQESLINFAHWIQWWKVYLFKFIVPFSDETCYILGKSNFWFNP